MGPILFALFATAFALNRENTQYFAVMLMLIQQHLDSSMAIRHEQSLINIIV